MKKERTMNTSDNFDVLAAWPIETPIALVPLAGGTNNRVWSVKTQGGSAYVLRLTSGVADLPRFRYEAALLTALRPREK